MAKLKCKAEITEFYPYTYYYVSFDFDRVWHCQSNLFKTKKEAKQSAKAFAKKLNIELEWVK